MGILNEKRCKRDMITQILKNIHELNVDLAKKIVHYYEEQI
jgi:hypothetical protein